MAVFTTNTMEKLVLLAFAACVLLISGCNKAAPVQTGSAQVTDWGVVEIVPSTPKHLQLEGKDCILTATPLADGKFAVVIEGDFGAADQNSPAGVPSGTPIHTTLNTIIPGNVECVFAVAQKQVRVTLKLKTTHG
ncbi:MAG: hypothetical protein ACXWKG_10320 [Limisphaerales bacterium]